MREQNKSSKPKKGEKRRHKKRLIQGWPDERAKEEVADSMPEVKIQIEAKFEVCMSSMIAHIWQNVH